MGTRSLEALLILLCGRTQCSHAIAKLSLIVHGLARLWQSVEAVGSSGRVRHVGPGRRQQMRAGSRSPRVGGCLVDVGRAGIGTGAGMRWFLEKG